MSHEWSAIALAFALALSVEVMGEVRWATFN